MNKCHFCSRFLDENGYCNYCNVLHCDHHFRINFLFAGNTINIIKNHDIGKFNIMRYYYDTQRCSIYLAESIMNRIQFEIKPSQSLENFKKIVQKHLKYNHLK